MSFSSASRSSTPHNRRPASRSKRPAAMSGRLGGLARSICVGEDPDQAAPRRYPQCRAGRLMPFLFPYNRAFPNGRVTFDDDGASEPGCLVDARSKDGAVGVAPGKENTHSTSRTIGPLKPRVSARDGDWCVARTGIWRRCHGFKWDYNRLGSCQIFRRALTASVEPGPSLRQGPSLRCSTAFQATSSGRPDPI